MLRTLGFVASVALLMVGCGGGGTSSPPPPPPPPLTFSIGGSVTGLTGSGLVLQTNAGDLVAVAGAGAFTFPKKLASGTAYTVSVNTQPSSPQQDCSVTNGSGTVGNASITNVVVACSPTATFTVGGTVSGLVGTGLTLTMCSAVGGPGGVHAYCPTTQEISANGAFTLAPGFPTEFLGHTASVRIVTQPASPVQHCVVSNATFTIQGANLNDVTVACAGYALVTNAADGTLAAYNINATTGALQAVGTPLSTGTAPYAIVGVEVLDKQFVYVGNEGSNDVSGFTFNKTTGALTAVPGSPFAVGTDPKAMARSGLVLYVANAGSANVSVYAIDPDTGALWAPGTIAGGKNSASIVIGPDLVIYLANHGGSNDISAMNSDGTAVPGSPFPTGGNPLGLALGAGGKFLYSANPDATNPTISGFTIDTATGALSPLGGSPFPLPVSNYIATDQTGAYLYVTVGTTIVGYAIDPTSGALAELPGFPVAAGANAYSITIDPTNQFLYVANEAGANVSGFRLDASTGALTPIPGSPFPAGNAPGFMATL
jgi:6-phosphogluconolactonase